MALPVAIVGGGISGLSAAHYLRLRGVPSIVIEPGKNLGGLLCTQKILGCTVEAGADSWLAAKPWARELASEVGLASEVIGSNDELRRVWVLKNGKLVPYPQGMQLVVPKRMGTVWKSPLFNLSTKLRMSADWVRFGSGPNEDRSVADFVRSHFGQGAVDYLAEPLLSGIYGGNPEQLSAEAVLPKFVERERRQGSITRGTTKETVEAGRSAFESMRGGLGQLIAALHPERSIRGAVETIERAGELWRLRIGGEWVEAARVILACPAPQAATICAAVAPELSQLLASVTYSSAHIVAMGFRNIDPLNGFGFLVPKVEGRNIMATTWVSSKFSHRVPGGMQLIRAFYRLPSPDPVHELKRIMGFKKFPEFTKEYRWPKSLPQYAVGHLDLVRQMEEQAAKLAGLHLIGNTYHGVGIPDCIHLAKRTVANILSAS